jgi:hypothetical protein
LLNGFLQLFLMYMTKTARKGKWVIGTVLFVLLTNVFAPVRLIPAMLTLGQETSLWGPMEYATLHGEVRTYQDGIIVFGASWSDVLHSFKKYKECHPSSPDTTLYRLYTFRISSGIISTISFAPSGGYRICRPIKYSRP